MAPLPENVDPQLVEKTLARMFTPEWLRDTAKRVKYVQRERKVDPFILFWILVLGFGVGVQRSLASLRRAYEKKSSQKIVPSAFYDRFTEGLFRFLKECLAHGIADLASHTSLKLSEKLQGFKDLVVNDGTIIKLHDMLAEKFPGARPQGRTQDTPRHWAHRQHQERRDFCRQDRRPEDDPYRLLGGEQHPFIWSRLLQVRDVQQGSGRPSVF